MDWMKKIMDLDILITKLNYQFNNPILLKAALTHRSVPGNNNERLEFLGDSVLNCVIATALYQRFPQAKEGELSRLRANLVKGETLAKLAQEFELSHYLRLGAGEIRSGGAQRESILADALEAVIGAIYLDSNFDICKSLILSWFDPRLNAVASTDLKDPKTELQEYLQAKKYPLPNYAIVEITGEAHAQFFHIQCQVAELSLISEGHGRSRRKAEQEAAKNLLELLKHE
jgi:ribonuclease-3